MTTKSLRALAALSVLTATASVVVFACSGADDDPFISATDVEFRGSDGGVASTLACGAEGGASLTANGVDVGVVHIQTTGWTPSDPTTFPLRVSSPDGRLTLSSFGLPSDAAAPPTAASFTSTLSTTTPGFDVAVRAGLTPGVARLDLSYGITTHEYCVDLTPTLVAAIALQIVPSTATPPSGWQTPPIQINATLLSADGTAISNGTDVSWSTKDCSYFASPLTVTVDGGTLSNTLYLAPGWTSTEITVSAGGVTPTIVCLSPGGASLPIMATGACPVSVADADAASPCSPIPGSDSGTK